MYCEGDPTIINCHLLDNEVNDKGAGMYNDGGNPTLIHCLFTGNSALLGGGAVARAPMRCWVGTLPLMQACGLAGRPNALVGLDLLRGDGRRTVVLDLDESKVWVER